MAVYKPLFMYLTPASIPQVVAHIQKYLADNPIVSDPEAIAEVIKKYIEEHPEIIAVASVNGKTGNVVLTGSDININASSAVSVETQLLNLASMISTAGADIAQINAQLETIYTNIGTIGTNVSNNTSAISALQTSVEVQGTRLATAETDIDNLETAQTAQRTRINAAEGNISSLQTRMTQAETDIDTNTAGIETINTNIETINTNIENLQTNVTSLTSPEQLSYQIMNGFADYDSEYNYAAKIGKLCVFHIVVIPTSTRSPGGLEFVIKGLPQPAHGVMFFGFVTDGVNVVAPARMAIVGDGEGSYGIRFHYPIVPTLTNEQPVIMTGSYITL